MKKIGYVLSGGGARGFAHLGILEFLNEMKLVPHAISGTSVGAVIGALYAAGKSPRNILELMKRNNYFGWSNLLWRKTGLFSMNILEKELSDAIVTDSFEALKIKLYVAATDLNLGETVFFSDGRLFDAVIASASIPVVFEPVIMGDKILVDGGLLNNFPVAPLIHNCDVIIGSHVNKLEKGIENISIFKTWNIAERCFHLAIAESVYSKIDKCDVFIEPSLHPYGLFDVAEADNIFEIGYQAALKYKYKIEQIMQAKVPVGKASQ